MVLSQASPVYPSAHVHFAVPVRSSHVPPLLQGFSAHVTDSEIKPDYHWNQFICIYNTQHNYEYSLQQQSRTRARSHTNTYTHIT